MKAIEATTLTGSLGWAILKPNTAPETSRAPSRSTVRHDIEVVRGPGEMLPASAMQLKQETAFYGMYLTFAQRDRLFSELDFLLDPDGWDEDDKLPRNSSYLSFLKWAVESKECDWSSLGLDGDGNIVASYVGDHGTLSAAFLSEDKVQWALRVETEDGLDVSAGQTPLRVFAATSKGLISRV